MEMMMMNTIQDFNNKKLYIIKTCVYIVKKLFI